MSLRNRTAGLLVAAALLALPTAAAAQFGAPRATNGVPSATISVQVTGAGARRELTWWVLRRANQRVIFEEHGGSGPRVLAITRGGTGSVRFRSAKSSSRRRRIVARVELNGVATERLAVARFSVRRR